jgi:hypothetical protein
MGQVEYVVTVTKMVGPDGRGICNVACPPEKLAQALLLMDDAKKCIMGQLIAAEQSRVPPIEVAPADFLSKVGKT